MHRLTIGWVFAAGLLISAASAKSDDAAQPPRGTAEGVADRAWAIIEAVQDHHINPPKRGQMITFGIAALHRICGIPPGNDVDRRAAAASSPEQFATLLDETWNFVQAGGKAPGSDVLEKALDQGLLGAVPDLAVLRSAAEFRVSQQIQGNAYVGLHIGLAYNKEEKRLQIKVVTEGGPAQRAGIRPDDLIEAVDGVATDGMDTAAIVDRLRGELGTSVTVRVRQPGSVEVRELKAVRGLLPRQTIQGIRNYEGGASDILIKGTEKIGYLKCLELSASTPNELRKLARRLEREGARALILDLRPIPDADFHATVLLADSLLAGGPIGRLRTARGVQTFEADPDALFPDLPLAVLVDGKTTGPVEWLAAALQDNRHATVVGLPTGWAQVLSRAMPLSKIGTVGKLPSRSDSADVRTAITFGADGRLLEMTTGRLEQRGDGRPLARPFPDRLLDRLRELHPSSPSTASRRRDGSSSLRAIVIDPPLKAEIAALIAAQADGDGGVTPTSSPGAIPPGAEAAASQEPREQDPSVAGDPILTAAVRHLRTGLEAAP